MILTSCRDPRVLEAVSRFPITDYQVKPLSPDRLAERLRSLLNCPGLRFTMAAQNGRLECSIARRTGGRIYDLRVETVDGRVTVRGRSDSHHIKQLCGPRCWRRLKHRTPNPEGLRWILKFRRSTVGRPGDCAIGN